MKLWCYSTRINHVIYFMIILPENIDHATDLGWLQSTNRLYFPSLNREKGRWMDGRYLASHQQALFALHSNNTRLIIHSGLLCALRFAERAKRHLTNLPPPPESSLRSALCSLLIRSNCTCAGTVQVCNSRWLCVTLNFPSAPRECGNPPPPRSVCFHAEMRALGAR